MIVVVVGNEVLHRIVGEECLELAVQLRRQRLVRCQDQRGALHLLDDVGDAEGLARAGHPQQSLVRQPRLDALDHLPNGLWLIACWLEPGNELELGHVEPRGAAL